MSLICVVFLLFPALTTRTSKHTHINSSLWLLFTVHNLRQSWLSTICNQLVSYLKLNFEAFITSLLWKHVEVDSKRVDSAKVFLFCHYICRSMNTSPIDKSILATCYNRGRPLISFSQRNWRYIKSPGERKFGSSMPLKPSNPDPVLDKNSSFCHPVEDKGP